MTTKGRGGAAGGPGTWPVYEDFKPNSEWQQDAHSHTLIVSLPGFMKEQLRVSTEGRNMIRVRGERLLAGNKWSRFLEDYEVPENSDMNSVRARFHEGDLTLTIPKKIVDKIHDFAPEKKGAKDSLVEKQEPTHHDQRKESSPPAHNQTETWRAEHEKQNAAKEEGKPEISKELGGEEKIKPRRDGAAAAIKEKVKGGKLEEVIESSRAKLSATEKGIEGRIKEAIESRQTEQRAKEKGNQGKRKEVVESGQAALAKAMKGVSELSEERRLMMNIGAAVLVIAAFSAYVTYKFVARDDDRK